MMIHQFHALASGLLLVLTACLTVVHYLFVEAGSVAESIIFVIAALAFALLAFLNLSLYRDTQSDAMTKVHAITRAVMFVIASAFALYLVIH